MAKRGRARKEARRGLPHFYGRHAVEAALDNPDRDVRKLFLTREAAATLEIPDGIPVQFCEVTDLARHVPKDAPHQGMVAEVDPLKWPALETANGAGVEDAFLYTRQTTFDSGDTVDTPRYDRDKLKAGHTLDGPAVVIQHNSTTLVPPGYRAKVNGYGNIHIRAQAGS